MTKKTDNKKVDTKKEESKKENEPKKELINFYELEDVKAFKRTYHNPNKHIHNIDVPFRILIIAYTGGGKTNTLQFHNAMALQAISTDRKFFIGSLSDASDGAVAQFMIGANGGGALDPNILMSLSRDAVYFFGVKQPLVPVGTIQIYAGTESPNGYLKCQGQLVSKTTYNLLWDLIGNTFLNGRTASSTHFYLPDLRQMYIKGAGTNTIYQFEVPVESASLGRFQEMSVQKHKHQYEDRGSASKTVSTGGVSSTTVADNITEIWYTKEGIVRPDPDNLNIGMEDNETRPNTIVMNYIIKF